MKDQWIGVLDCNNFFVSCERLFRPDLKDKPVVVLSSNDGCVVARSQEIKDINVPMGVPYFQIKDILKNADATVFSSHFALYRDVSRRVFSVMRDVLDDVEQYSVDEAFFKIDDNPLESARGLKEIVEQRVGIPVSIGVSSTKTLAKFANGIAKKGTGVAVLDRDSWLKKAPRAPLASIWGVGGKSEMHYKKAGLLTAADLIELDSDRVRALFGVVGSRLQAELSGRPVYGKETRLEPQKSVMSSRSFAESVDDVQVLKDAISYHLRHAAADIRAMKSLATRMRISIQPGRHSDFFLHGKTKELVLTTPSNDTISLLKIAEETVDELYEEGVPYKKAGVVLSGLVPAGAGQQSLFTEGSTDQENPLLQVVDSLNGQSGQELILIGSRLKTKKWQTRRESRSPAYTTNWRDVATVKAK
tara:strand:+ start:13637 stop:14887 length:1251 start_codon:yes stop_codon:yes gene_type:complete